jgi:hypothetical protein
MLVRTWLEETVRESSKRGRELDFFDAMEV